MIFANRIIFRAGAGKYICRTVKYRMKKSDNIFLKLWRKRKIVKKPILIKKDRELGYAYFCSHCKSFQCIGYGPCTVCGILIDWESSIPYEGRVKWKT